MSRAIFATEAVINDPQATAILASSGLKPESQRKALRGIADAVTVYEIP